MEPPTLTTGERIKLCRTRAGKSRPVLAGLVGRSPGWLKAVETGTLLPPRLPMLTQLATALGVPVAALAEDARAAPVSLSGPRHPALAAVRSALNRPDAGAALPLADLRREIAATWRLRHASPHHRTAVGPRVAHLLAAAHATVRAQDQRGPLLAAQGLLADVCGLAQTYVAYQSGASDILWRVIDRMVVAGWDSAEPVALAAAAWGAGLAHRETGDFEAGLDALDSALAEVEPRLPDGSTELLALYGALHSEVATIAARLGESGRALRSLDRAAAVADRLPAGYFQRQTGFGPAFVAVHTTTIEVDLRRPGSALRAAGRATPLPSRPRWARHLVEVARAHHQRGTHDETVAALRAAHASAPDTVRWNPFARRIALDLLDIRGQRALAHEAATLVGLTS
ncbi:transcriptional regulator [Pilimelia anulata]|uniref:Transcriptional regulator n=1 Tax=Pilimelia anulata TaxID=53371 RepID=A0A8J3BA44_9ACTN|nr:transcriptional regulator [Pilimelia anulata]GGJ98939.1 transcriptional regulator [Pilimelia anulata]